MSSKSTYYRNLRQIRLMKVLRDNPYLQPHIRLNKSLPGGFSPRNHHVVTCGLQPGAHDPAGNCKVRQEQPQICTSQPRNIQPLEQHPNNIDGDHEINDLQLQEHQRDENGGDSFDDPMTSQPPVLANTIACTSLTPSATSLGRKPV